MQKTLELFDAENEARKQLEFSRRSLPRVKIWEVWWYYVGLNIGQEISKTAPYRRPCIILKIMPRSSLVLVVPLSTKLYTQRSESSIEIKNPKKYGLKPSWVLIHHTKSIDKLRLVSKVRWKRLSKHFVNALLKKLL